MDEDFGPHDLDSIFRNLGREIRRPLGALREGLEHLVGDPTHPVGESDRAQAEILLTLCADLRQLTDSCLGGPGEKDPEI